MNRNLVRPFSFFTLLSATIAFSCTKKHDGGSAITSQSLSGTYRIAAVTAKTGTSAPVDILAASDPCQKDDEVKLNADGTYADIDAGSKCTPPGDSQGMWSLLGNNKMKIDSDTATINSFDGSNLVLSTTEDLNGNGTMYTVTETLTKK